MLHQNFFRGVLFCMILVIPAQGAVDYVSRKEFISLQKELTDTTRKLKTTEINERTDKSSIGRPDDDVENLKKKLNEVLILQAQTQERLGILEKGILALTNTLWNILGNTNTSVDKSHLQNNGESYKLKLDELKFHIGLKSSHIEHQIEILRALVNTALANPARSH